MGGPGAAEASVDSGSDEGGSSKSWRGCGGWGNGQVDGAGVQCGVGQRRPSVKQEAAGDVTAQCLSAVGWTPHWSELTREWAGQWE